MQINELTHQVIGLAMKVHSALGPGLLESVYQECLFYELDKAAIVVEKEKPMPIIYDALKFECGYRLDLLVEEVLPLELKSVEKLTNVHMAQMLTYQKLGGYKIGLLINFNVTKLKDGIKRVII